MNTIHKSCGIIPIRKTENGYQYLLIQHNEGHWGFPKGHQEGKETDIATALRELREETGIAQCEIIRDQPLREHYKFRNSKGPIEKIVLYFIGLTTQAEVTTQKTEIQSYKWLPYHQALEQASYKGAKNLIEKTEKFITEKMVK